MNSTVRYLVLCFILVLAEANAQTVVPDFTFDASICVGDPVTINNNTTGGTTFKWKFCAKDLNQAPASQDLGSFGDLLDQPAYIDIVSAGANFYGFVTNFGSGDLIRLDFGNSLLNTPTAVNLGNINGLLPSGGNGGIRVVQDQGKWYAIIVSGYPPGGVNPRISKIDFGANITNPNPISTDWGNEGNMYDPNDLILVHEGNTWIALTVNGETNTISRFNFGSSLDNSPIGTNLGNLGNLEEPAGLYLIYENGEAIVFITNSGDKTRIGGDFKLTRLNFGNSLLNAPLAENVGNVGNMLQHPRDITMVPYCNETLGFILNGHPFYNSWLKLDFNNDVMGFPIANEMGRLSGFDYPNSIAGFFNQGEDLVAFTLSRNSNALTRVTFTDCNNSSIAGSAAQQPPPFSYNQPGIFNIQLIVDEGLASETSLCKQILVTACTDTLIITNDTTICAGDTIKIRTHPAASYQWSPSTSLDNAASASPSVTPAQTIRYYVDALLPADNLVTNGDFSGGNASFTSAYQYTATNVTEGEYFIGKDPHAWNISLDFCSDHTSGTGNMLLANGAPTAGLILWSQTVNIKPNTDYQFSAFLQSIWATNPANIQLLINGTAVGAPIPAAATACIWTLAETTWNSGGSNTATLAIVDANTNTIGNDFAIDDISFSELIRVRDSITINVRQPFIKTNEDTTICEGTPVQLNVDQGAFFTWTPSTGLSNSGVPNPIATPNTTTAYEVIGIDPAGCLAKDTVLITVKPSPIVSVTSDTTVCKATVLQLTATGGDTFEWTPATGLNDANISNPVVSANADVDYRVRVTAANGCYRDDSVRITVRQQPQFAATGPEQVCAGSSVTLMATGGDSYQWTPSTEMPDPGLSTVAFAPTKSETYTVNIHESVCNYDTTIRFSVAVTPVPKLTITKSNDVSCTVPSAQLSVSGASGYVWTPAASLDNASSATPLAVPDTSTVYTVTGTNEYGCTADTSVIVKVDNSGVPGFVVPSAFTPNKDGKNDCFGIQRWGNAEIKQFSIFNRWGTMIFTATSPSQCWDGTWNGKPQAGGGYIYVIRANTFCGQVTRKGMLMLIR